MQPPDYTAAWIVGDIHSDMEVWLRFLEHVGLVVDRQAESVETLVAWGEVERTMLLVCGDWIDRRRSGASRDNARARLVYSARRNGTAISYGTDGEIPYEEVLILGTVAHLVATQRRSGNRLVMVLGNHDIAMLVHSRSMPNYTTPLAMLSESTASSSHTAQQLRTWRAAAREEIRAFGQLSSFAAFPVPAATALLERTTTTARPGLHAAFHRCASAAVPFYAVGKYIFSHAGITGSTAVDWRQRLGITDGAALMRALCNPNRTPASLAAATDGTVPPDALLTALQAESNLFWSRPKGGHGAALGKALSQTDVANLGLRFYEPLTHNVLAHNCGAEFAWPSNTTMLDKCGSRAMLEIVKMQYAPNGPIRIGRIDLQVRSANDFPDATDRLPRAPSGPEFDSPGDMVTIDLPPIDGWPGDTGQGHVMRNSSLRNPLLEQCGLVVLADWDTLRRQWVPRS
jgi:hypothetical protein